GPSPAAPAGRQGAVRSDRRRREPPHAPARRHHPQDRPRGQRRHLPDAVPGGDLMAGWSKAASRVASAARWAAGSWWVRLAVTAGLLAIVATRIEWSVLVDRLEQGSWGWFALAVAFVFAPPLVGAVRWHVLLRAGQVRTTPLRTLHTYGIGMFTNLF